MMADYQEKTRAKAGCAARARRKAFIAVLAAALGAGAADGLLEVAAGSMSRTLDTGGGKLLGHSYRAADGTEFMRKGSPEFAFRVDGRMYSGGANWKDVAVARNEAKDGSRTVAVTGVSADGRVGVTLSYTTYPGLALVRKTLSIENKDDRDVAITDVDVETFRLATLGCINSRVMRRFARYREEGGVYVGDWNDPLVVVHDYAKRCGIAVGNEGVSTMKRTTAFQDGNFIVSGTPHVGERYPFRKWLKPGERWTAMPVFTAPYANCADTSRVVEGAVADYVRKHMGVRVERIPKKPMFVYNTWVPFRTRVDAQLVRELADAAAECGIEEFVIDDGWQVNVSDGAYGRGDWAVDEKKFPGGLKPTFDYIKSKGMRPGLWLSLAWADPASAPMKEHPEWFVKDKAGNVANLHTSGGSTRTACMATPWREYIRDKILGLVKDHGLAYVKLDLAIATSAYVYDDRITGCYAKDHPGHRGHEDSYDAIFSSCMRLFDELHAAAPDLFIDCTFETAGKTFLMDYGIAKHAEGNWLSNIRSGDDGRLYVRNLAWGRTPALPASSLVIGNLHMNGERHLLSFKALAGTLPIMLGDPPRAHRVRTGRVPGVGVVAQGARGAPRVHVVPPGPSRLRRTGRGRVGRFRADQHGDEERRPRGRLPPQRGGTLPMRHGTRTRSRRAVRGEEGPPARTGCGVDRPRAGGARLSGGVPQPNRRRTVRDFACRERRLENHPVRRQGRPARA